MSQLYDLITAVLGEDMDSKQWRQLLNMTDVEPQQTEVEGDLLFEFPDLGFGLAYSPAKSVFWQASFEVATAQPVLFSSPMHNGIVRGDSPRTVEEKLGIEPFSFRQLKSGRCIARYSIAPLVLTCLFASDNGELVGLTINLESEASFR